MNEWKIHHSFITPNHKNKKWGEIDFIFIIPDKGVVCLEIKSHKFIEYKGGEWNFGNRNKKAEDPFKQVMNASEALKSRLSDHATWINNIPWFHGVMFTDSDIPKNYQPMQFEKWQFLGPDCLSEDAFKRSIIELSEKGMIAQNRGKNVFKIGNDALNNLNNLLLNECIFYSSPKTQRELNHQNLLLVTKEQKKILRYIRSNKKIYIDGYAGTGKTILAISEARSLANEGKEVLFLCPSEALKIILNNGDLGSLEKLKICTLSELESNQNLFNQNQAVIIDEAQDIFFNKDSFTKLKNIFENFFYEDQSTWRLFGDTSRQRNLSNFDDEDILLKYEKVGFIPKQAYKVTLRDNYRNKKKIVNGLKDLCNVQYEDIKRQEDDENAYLVFPYNTRKEQFDLLIKELHKYKDYPNSEKVILSPYQEKSIAYEYKDEFKKLGFNLENVITSENDSIFFDTISNFKGLERSLVFITDFDEDHQMENVNNSLYTALTRSTDKAFLFIDRNTFF